MNRILQAMPKKRSIKIARTVRGAHSQLSSLFGFKLKENFFDHTSNKLKTMERKKRHYHTNEKKNIVMRSKQGLFFRLGGPIELGHCVTFNRTKISHCFTLRERKYYYFN